ncbi:ABC transporter ATP-binding protein [Candidatus Roizmanbacteria bacterium]|nr:ABC transporter ATP-binding protein [Candidatus Roizmanbacteria bacterium]
MTKIFKNKTAVDNISFTAKEGEIIGFLGPNGAGKTTTMRLILGYLTPTEGKISVDNLDPLEQRIDVLKKIGYLPENNPLYQEMKVTEYLQFIASVKNIDGFIEIASQVGLSEVLSSKIEELSRGYKQRVGLAAALTGNPSILILDEPTSGLDPLEQEKIRNLIKKLARAKTIIFSTHILSEVEDVANRLIIIDKGRIVFDGKKPKGKGAVEKLFKKLVKE